MRVTGQDYELNIGTPAEECGQLSPNPIPSPNPNPNPISTPAEECGHVGSYPNLTLTLTLTLTLLAHLLRSAAREAELGLG